MKEGRKDLVLLGERVQPARPRVVAHVFNVERHVFADFRFGRDGEGVPLEEADLTDVQVTELPGAAQQRIVLLKRPRVQKRRRRVRAQILLRVDRFCAVLV